MLAFRWLLGLIILGLGGSFVVLGIVATGFRKSFGASPINPLTTAVPMAAMLVLLAGLIWPANRALLHTGAVSAAGLLAFCVYMMITESAVSMWFGVFYLMGWLYFYWQSVSAT